MGTIDYRSLSKTLAYMLRHGPSEFGLTLDAAGWAEISAVLGALRARRREWRQIALADIEEMIRLSEKKRYEIHANGLLIRAFYGHSLQEKIQKQPQEPPPMLFHGTTPEAARSILRQGLRPMNRQYVHLSLDQQTAITVAQRRTATPVILLIQAQQAYRQGIPFYAELNGIWLSEPIPASFIRLLEDGDA
jgi:putative RNA 2'-phosphotransferase